jgi:hypothetical protein
MKFGIALSIIFSLFPLTVAQQENTSTFYVRSWKKGEAKIQRQSLVVELGTNNPEFQKTINDSEGKPRYILQIRHWPLKADSYLFESWWVDMCEFRKPNRKPKVATDCKLLGVEGRGVGDNFPKEDNIGWLYPLEKPELFKHGVSAYPILAKRVVKVDGFYCVIQVTGYKLSQANPKAVDSLTVEIELTNEYEIPKTAA